MSYALSVKEILRGLCEMSNIKDCSICKYCDEDLIFDEETGEEYPFYKCQKGNDTSLDYECNDFERFRGINIADVIKSIEREAFREVQAHEIAGINGEPIDCSALGDEPVIVADNEADRQVLRDCLKE